MEVKVGQYRIVKEGYIYKITHITQVTQANREVVRVKVVKTLSPDFQYLHDKERSWHIRAVEEDPLCPAFNTELWKLLND